MSPRRPIIAALAGLVAALSLLGAGTAAITSADADPAVEQPAEQDTTTDPPARNHFKPRR